MSAILPNDHRTSCHRCGNIRKNLHQCSECPQVFCSRCKEKMVLHHGIGVFTKGCPVCKNLCCCGQNRSLACTQQFHCYKKCPTTRLGGINFGVCTPSPSEVVKYSQSREKRTVQHSEEGPRTPAAYYSNNTQMPVAMAVTDDRMKYSDNLFQVVKAQYAEEGASDIPRDDHGSVDDIEHFFISADDWDRSQFTGSTRFYEEQNSAEEDDYVYGTSSASMVISTAYADNTIKDIYPFLSTPTPTSSAPRSPQVRTSPARTERTSSLPLPSAQVHFYHNARVSDGMIDTVRAAGATDAKVQIDSCSHRLHEEVTCRAASNHPKPYICPPDPNEKMLSGYGNQSLHQLNDISTDQESADSKTASIAKKELKGKLSKPSHVLYQDQDVKTGAKCNAKKARSGSTDNLIADPTTGPSRDSNLGPLESFLSSNYFIQDGLHDLTGPFFLQQSLHCHAKAPSLKELMSGLAATATTTGVGTDVSGLTANGKKRYRKHPASISATKIKNEALLASQVTNRDRRKEARMDHNSQSSPSMHVSDADRQRPDEDRKLSSIHDRGAERAPVEDMWTVLRGNSFKENATATENTSMKDNVYKLHERTNRDAGDSFTGHHTSSETSSSSAATIRNGSYRIPREDSEYMDDRGEDDFGSGFSRERPQHEDLRRPSGNYSDALEMTSVQGLSARRSAARDHPKSQISNREDLQEHSVLEYGVRHPMERASRQTSFQDIYDPFQKFDDYYVMGSDPGFREAAVPIVNNVCILGSPWKYSYFSSEESQKDYTQTRPCRARYEYQNTSDSSSPAIDARSLTVADCREVSIDVDVDAGVDELLISTLVEHIADDADDSPNVERTVPNIFNESVVATAGAIELTALMSPRAEGQGGEHSAEASSFPVPTNAMYQYRVKSNQEIRSPKRLGSSISNSSSANGTPSKSNPPLENVSFSPFMNFTPESGAKAVEHMGTGFGSGISSGMAPFNILSVEPYTGEQSKGEKDQTVSVATSAAVVALSRSSSDVVPESALGWLDYTYDFAAE